MTKPLLPAALTPREEVDALIVRALSINIAAEDRDYTAGELDEILYCLIMASVQLKKLPGGDLANMRMRKRAKDEIERRRRARGTTTEPATMPITGAAVVNRMPREIGGTVTLRLAGMGMPGAKPLWACAATGKLLRTDACPNHPDAPCALVGYEIVEGT